MFWGQNSKLLRRVAAAFLLSFVATAATAEVLVVRATGPSAPSYRAGMKLADNAKISLKANDTLVLLDGRGTRTLRGPGDFTPASAPQASRRTALAAVATPAAGRRARIGAVRDPGRPAPRNIWLVDVDKSTTMCVADPAGVMMWRSDASKPVTLTVTRTGDGAVREVEWARRETTLAWPADLAIADGADYRLSWRGAAKPTDIKFRTLPARPSGLEDMASAFIENSCQAQLDLLVETVQMPATEDAPAG